MGLLGWYALLTGKQSMSDHKTWILGGSNVETSGLAVWEFLAYVSVHKFFKKDSASWSKSVSQSVS
jgi:hypothetical protein